MMDHIDAIRQAIDERDFQRIDDIWTEIITDESVGLPTLFDIARKLARIGESERALFLLDLLATHLESMNKLSETIAIYREILTYKKENTAIRKKLIALYRELYKQSPYINQYIEFAGLDKNEPVFRSLDRIEEFLTYDIGECFYFERYGFGEVTEVIPAKREIVIDFEKKRRHFLTLDIAKGLLLAIPNEHYLYKKHKDIESLKKMAQSEPATLVKYLLRSFSQPLSGSQIKSHLSGVVDDEELNKFWDKARKVLEGDENIKVTGRTAKTYLYTEEAIDHAKETIQVFEKASPEERYQIAEIYAKKEPGLFLRMLPGLVEQANKIYKGEPGLALSILLLAKEHKKDHGFVFDIDLVLQGEKPEVLVKKLTNLEHQRIILERIREKNPQTWPAIFESIILNNRNPKLLDEISRGLEAMPDRLHSIYQKILFMPNQYPAQYQWLVKRLQGGGLDNQYLNPAFITRFIGSLEYIKSLKSSLDKILPLERFDQILKNARDDDARYIINALNNSGVLADYQKKDFLRIIEHHFPHLFEREADVIYATAEALKRKKDELDRIYLVEIPENKKEIGRAREFGDLSENFEYKAAKERQDQLYQRTRMLEADIKKTQLINHGAIDTSRVEVGTKVTLKTAETGSMISYTILGRWDTDLGRNIISNEAPVAKALIGRGINDQVIINGQTCQIVEIEKGI